MKLAKPLSGEIVNPPARGFPQFTFNSRKRRIITADIWEYLRFVSRSKLKKNQANEALAHIDQAFEFYSAASNPRQSSRPLLYYYSFLNLSKIALLHSGLSYPPQLKHGISDPKANLRDRLHFKTQKVRSTGRANNNSELFPELIYAFSRGRIQPQQNEYYVVDLLSEVPAIHRTFCTLYDRSPKFIPIEQINIIKASSKIWVRLTFKKQDKDVVIPLRGLKTQPDFKAIFTQKESKEESRVIYETQPVSYSRRGIETKIRHVANQIADMGIWSTLTPFGYSYYFYSDPKRSKLPQACVSYAVMFYLGSLTRYKPYDYDKITKDHSWLLGEFLDTQPVQFLALVASHIAGTEVVYPFAMRV